MVRGEIEIEWVCEECKAPVPVLHSTTGQDPTPSTSNNNVSNAPASSENNREESNAPASKESTREESNAPASTESTREESNAPASSESTNDQPAPPASSDRTNDQSNAPASSESINDQFNAPASDLSRRHSEVMGRLSVGQPVGQSTMIEDPDDTRGRRSEIPGSIIALETPPFNDLGPGATAGTPTDRLHADTSSHIAPPSVTGPTPNYTDDSDTRHVPMGGAEDVIPEDNTEEMEVDTPEAAMPTARSLNDPAYVFPEVDSSDEEMEMETDAGPVPTYESFRVDRELRPIAPRRFSTLANVVVDPVPDTLLPNLPPSYSIIPGASVRGGDLLSDGCGYTYSKRRETSKSISWACSSRGKKCGATVKQVGETYTRGPKDHNHGGEPEKTVRVKARALVSELG